MAIITLAPEKVGALETIEDLSKQGITMAVGHSTANLSDGEKAVQKGSNLITHLFNAMLPVSNFIDYHTITIFNLYMQMIVSPSWPWSSGSTDIGRSSWITYRVLRYNIRRRSHPSSRFAYCFSSASEWFDFGHRRHLGNGLRRWHPLYRSINGRCTQ